MLSSQNRRSSSLAGRRAPASAASATAPQTTAAALTASIDFSKNRGTVAPQEFGGRQLAKCKFQISRGGMQWLSGRGIWPAAMVRMTKCPFRLTFLHGSRNAGETPVAGQRLSCKGLMYNGLRTNGIIATGGLGRGRLKTMALSPTETL